MYYVLITLSSGKSPHLRITTAALFKWAKLLSVGRKDERGIPVNLLKVPAEVDTHSKNDTFSDEDLSSNCRSKKAKAAPSPEMLSPPNKRLSVCSPSPAAEQLTSWTSPVAMRHVLPAHAPGDADLEEWTEASRNVRGFPPLPSS